MAPAVEMDKHGKEIKIMETTKIKEILSEQLELLAKDSNGCSGVELAEVSDSMLRIAVWLASHPVLHTGTSSGS